MPWTDTLQFHDVPILKPSLLLRFFLLGSCGAPAPPPSHLPTHTPPHPHHTTPTHPTHTPPHTASTPSHRHPPTRDATSCRAVVTYSETSLRGKITVVYMTRLWLDRKGAAGVATACGRDIGLQSAQGPARATSRPRDKAYIWYARAAVGRWTDMLQRIYLAVWTTTAISHLVRTLVLLTWCSTFHHRMENYHDIS